MSRGPDYLYELLPVVYRMRDAEQSYALRGLLRVMGEQLNVVEDDIAQLYENWFIETCEEWVVPYLGDLVGQRPVHGLADTRADTRETGCCGTAERLRAKFVAPRREVANTIDLRRRKGTLALLEALANDVADWPAHAVEFYRLLGWTQHMNHAHPLRGRTLELRAGDALDRLGSAFDATAHTVDLRRPNSHRAQGRYNVPSVGVFVWRLQSYSVTRSQACCVEKQGAQCYTFSALGNDTPLYTAKRRAAETTQASRELSVPAPIRRRAFEARTSTPPGAHAADAYYGAGKSLSIVVQDWPSRGTHGLIPAQDVVPADLRDWHGYRAGRNKVLVDATRGRMLFPVGQLPKGVWVSYHYGFSADMGGGEYTRTLSQPQAARVYRVRRSAAATSTDYETISEAYAQWQRDKQDLGLEAGAAPRAAVIEIADSCVYEESLVFALDAGESLQLRAADQTRPMLRLLDRRNDQPDPFSVSGQQGSRFTLDGLLVSGRGFEIDRAEGSDNDAENGDLCDVTIRHCTLVPGWDLDCDCEPQRPEEPAITLRYSSARLKIESSIVGAIWVIADERRSDPVAISICDSIVDATQEDGLALCAEDGRLAFASLSIARSTVIGGVQTHAIQAAENCLFTSPVQVARRQIGCMRFCHVVEDSRTPRRFHCQPELALSRVAEDLRAQAALAKLPPDEAAIARAQARERSRVRVRFNTTRYGTPGYCQLASDCAQELARGADDEAEMGAFHNLFQPQRAANLRARLDEYTPADTEAGIIYVT